MQAREGDCVKGDLQQKDSSEIERKDLQHGSETCYDASLGFSGIKKKRVSELRVLRFSVGVIGVDGIRNERKCAEDSLMRRLVPSL